MPSRIILVASSPEAKMKTSDNTKIFEDIHNQEHILAASKKALEGKTISSEDKKLIIEYIENKTDKNTLTTARQARLYQILNGFCDVLDKPILKHTEEDLIGLWRRYKNSPIHFWRWKDGQLIKTNTNRKRSTSTLEGNLIGFKDFLRWIRKSKKLSWDTDKESDLFKEELTAPKAKIKKLSQSEIISWEEAVELSKATKQLRDRALVQVLWDSGARIQELLTLRIKDVKPGYDNRAVYLCIWKSKTESRDVLVIDSAPTLLELLEQHPRKHDTEAALWLAKDETPLKYGAVRTMLLKAARRIKFTKRVNPHTFRKSETSVRTELSDPETKARHGWTQGSRMLDIYRHPSMTNADNKLLAARGLIKVEDTKASDAAKPKTCPNCGKLNAAGRGICANPICKWPLTQKSFEVAQERKNLTIEVLAEVERDHPEILNLLAEALAKKINAQGH